MAKKLFKKLNMSSFYSLDELFNLNLAKFGSNVLISRFAQIYNPQNLEIGNNVRIDDFCIISAGIGTKIGSHVHISAYVGIWANRGLTISDYCNISMGSRILTESDDFTGLALVGPMFPIEKRKLHGGPMIIQKFVNIGANVTILPLSEIPEGAAIGAGSLVVKPLKAWSINFGCPAKFVRERSREMLKLL